MNENPAYRVVKTLTACKPGWDVPTGFATFELTETFEGPIHHGDGHVGYGPHEYHREYHLGVQHIYDDGEFRIVVRPGSRESYAGPGYYMEIETLAGRPGKQFGNVHAALAAARDEVLRR